MGDICGVIYLRRMDERSTKQARERREISGCLLIIMRDLKTLHGIAKYRWKDNKTDVNWSGYKDLIFEVQYTAQ
jgi:hypothetical protein